MNTCYFLRSAPFFWRYWQVYSSKMREKTQKGENMNLRKWKGSPWPWARKESGYLWCQSLVAAAPLLIYTWASWPIQRWTTARVVLLLFCPTQVRRIITKVPYETILFVVSHSQPRQSTLSVVLLPPSTMFQKLRSWSLRKPVTQALFPGIICG